MAPLVCRSWRALVDSPHLLRSLALSLDCSRPAVLPSFCGWLAGRAAGHVQRLDLELRAGGLTPALRTHADTELLFAALQARYRSRLRHACGSSQRMRCPICQNANRTTGAPLPHTRPTRPIQRILPQACVAGAALRQLRLRVDSQLTVSPEALGPLCASLERLSLAAASKSHESASTAIYAFGLEALTRLEELELAGSAVELHRSQLPPRLTQLRLQGFRDLTSRQANSSRPACAPCACAVWVGGLRHGAPPVGVVAAALQPACRTNAGHMSSISPTLHPQSLCCSMRHSLPRQASCRRPAWGWLAAVRALGAAAAFGLCLRPAACG